MPGTEHSVLDIGCAAATLEPGAQAITPDCRSNRCIDWLEAAPAAPEMTA